jgi:hypothetical protein
MQKDPGFRPHYFQPAIYPELLDGQFRDLQTPGAPTTPGAPENDCYTIDLDQSPIGPWGPEPDSAKLAAEFLDWLNDQAE